MAITPADAKVNVDIADIECGCGCDTKTCGTMCADKTDCGCKLDVMKYITVDAVKAEELKKIAVIADEKGNVNIILPKEWKFRFHPKYP